MIIIGCDFHPSWQQICWLDKETGETAGRSWCMDREMHRSFINSWRHRC